MSNFQANQALPTEPMVGGKSATELISYFKNTDEQLRMAIEQNDDEKIREYGAEADIAINQLIEFESSSQSDRQQVLGFLIRNFLFDEADENSLKNRICNKLLESI